MKNEEGITELLAESLKKQDKQEVILNRHTQLLEKLVDSQVALAEEFRQLRSDFNKMTDFLQTKDSKLEDRVKRLEDKVFRP